MNKEKIKQTKEIYCAKFQKENNNKAAQFISKPFFSRLKEKLENK